MKSLITSYQKDGSSNWTYQANWWAWAARCPSTGAPTLERENQLLATTAPAAASPKSAPSASRPYISTWNSWLAIIWYITISMFNFLGSVGLMKAKSDWVKTHSKSVVSAFSTKALNIFQKFEGLVGNENWQKK